MPESPNSPSAGRVDAFLRQTELARSDESTCSYLPGRLARTEGFVLQHNAGGGAYRALMDRGFRRSEYVIYRPVCAACRLCTPVRVPTGTFQPTRSQRRVWRRNADVCVEDGDHAATQEKYEIYARYQDEQHDGSMAADFAAFARFGYSAPVPTRELCYRVGRRLVGVSLLDTVPGAWSSMYMYFDPREGRRSLGTFSVLWEIDLARRAGIPYYYLGYYVPGSRTMAYKGRFQPAELLDPTGNWLPFGACPVEAFQPPGGA